MIYTFEAEDGERIDLSYPVSEAPRIGQWVKVSRRIEDGGIPSSTRRATR